jgi:hypothetical protein
MEIFVLGIVLVAVASMVIGMVWYSLPVFGKPWMKETGITMESAGNDSKVGYLLTTLGSLVMGSAFNYLVVATNTTTAANGAVLGLLVWVGFVATSFLATYTFSQKSFRLYLIDSTYFLASFIAAGIIMGYFN